MSNVEGFQIEVSAGVDDASLDAVVDRLERAMKEAVSRGGSRGVDSLQRALSDVKIDLGKKGVDLGNFESFNQLASRLESGIAGTTKAIDLQLASFVPRLKEIISLIGRIDPIVTTVAPGGTPGLAQSRTNARGASEAGLASAREKLRLTDQTAEAEARIEDILLRSAKAQREATVAAEQARRASDGQEQDAKARAAAENQVTGSLEEQLRVVKSIEAARKSANALFKSAGIEPGLADDVFKIEQKLVNLERQRVAALNDGNAALVAQIDSQTQLLALERRAAATANPRIEAALRKSNNLAIKQGEVIAAAVKENEKRLTEVTRQEEIRRTSAVASGLRQREEVIRTANRQGLIEARVDAQKQIEINKRRVALIAKIIEGGLKFSGKAAVASIKGLGVAISAGLKAVGATVRASARALAATISVALKIALAPLTLAVKTVGVTAKLLNRAFLGLFSSITATISSGSQRIASALRGLFTFKDDGLSRSLRRREEEFSSSNRRIEQDARESASRRTRIAADGVIAESQAISRARAREQAAIGNLRNANQTSLLGATTRSLGVFAGGAAIIQGIRKSFTEAVSLNEELNKGQVIFGEYFKTVNDFAKAGPRALALTRAQALQAASAFGNAFTGAGVAKDQAAELSKSLVTLGVDLASFNNIEVEEALAALKSGLAGETEPLRRLGIEFSAAEIKARALKDGIIQQGQELTSAQKKLITYTLITEKAFNAQDDFAETANSTANRLRVLGAIAASIGGGFAAKFEPAVRKALGALIPLGETIAKLVDGDVSGKLATLRTALIGIGSAAGGLVAIRLGIEGIGQASRALSLAFTPFGAALLVVGALGGAFALAYKQSEAFREFLGSLGKTVGQIGQQIKGALGGALVGLRDGFVRVATPALKEFGDFLTGGVFPAILRFANFVRDELSSRISAFASAVGRVALPVLKSFGEFFVRTLNPAVEAVGRAFDERVLPALKRVSAFLGPVIEGLGTAAKTLGSALSTLFKTSDFSAFGSAAKVAGEQVVNALKPIGILIAGTLTAALAIVGEKLGSIFTGENLKRVALGALNVVRVIGRGIGRIATSPEFLASVAAIGAALAAAAVVIGGTFVRGLLEGINENRSFLLKIGAVIATTIVAGLAVKSLAVKLASSLGGAIASNFRSVGALSAQEFDEGFKPITRNGPGGFLSSFFGSPEGIAKTAQGNVEAGFNAASRAVERESARLRRLLARAGQAALPITPSLNPATGLRDITAERAAVDTLREQLGKAGFAGLEARERVDAFFKAFALGGKVAATPLRLVTEGLKATGAGLRATVSNLTSSIGPGIRNLLQLSFGDPGKFADFEGGGRKSGVSFTKAFKQSFSAGFSNIRSDFSNLMAGLRDNAAANGTTVGSQAARGIAAGLGAGLASFAAGNAGGGSSSGTTQILSLLGIGATSIATGAALGGGLGAAVGTASAALGVLGFAFGASGREAEAAKQKMEKFSSALDQILTPALLDMIKTANSGEEALRRLANAGDENALADFVSADFDTNTFKLFDRLGLTIKGDLIPALADGKVGIEGFVDQLLQAEIASGNLDLSGTTGALRGLLGLGDQDYFSRYLTDAQKLEAITKGLVGQTGDLTAVQQDFADVILQSDFAKPYKDLVGDAKDAGKVVGDNAIRQRAMGDASEDAAQKIRGTADALKGVAQVDLTTIEGSFTTIGSLADDSTARLSFLNDQIQAIFNPGSAKPLQTAITSAVQQAENFGTAVQEALAKGGTFGGADLQATLAAQVSNIGTVVQGALAENPALSPEQLRSQIQPVLDAQVEALRTAGVPTDVIDLFLADVKSKLDAASVPLNFEADVSAALASLRPLFDQLTTLNNGVEIPIDVVLSKPQFSARDGEAKGLAGFDATNLGLKAIDIPIQIALITRQQRDAAAADAQRVGAAIDQGMARGITSSNAARSAAQARADQLIRITRTAFDVRSPSRVFAEIGKQVSAGLAKGITDNTDPASAATDLVKKVIDSTLTELDKGRIALSTARASLFDSLFTGFDAVGTKTADAARAGIAGSFDGIQSAFQDAKDKLQEIADKKGVNLTIGEKLIAGESALSLRIGDDLGAANRKAIADAVASIQEVGRTRLAGGEDVKTVASEVASLRDEMIALASSLGFNTGELQALVDSLGLSRSAIDDFAAGVASIDASRASTTTTAKTPANTPPAVNAVEQYFNLSFTNPYADPEATSLAVANRIARLVRT